jgi:carnitine-CoA ligase
MPSTAADHTPLDARPARTRLLDDDRDGAAGVARVTSGDLDCPWSGVAPTTILDVLHQACAADPAAPAFIFEDGLVVTRGDLRTRIETFAGYLAPRLQPGDRVAVMLGNRVEWMVAWFAAVGCRATVVSMNHEAQEHDAGYVVRDSGAVLVITDAEHARLFFSRLRESCPAVKGVLVVDGQEPDGLAAYAGDLMPLGEMAARSISCDIINIYYTSGTTGFPKGCMVDHIYWLRFVDLFQRMYVMEPSDRLICCLQFFYNDPPWHTLLSLTVRAPLVVMRRFSVSRFWNVVRDNDVTIVFGIASIASLLLRAPPHERDRDHKVRFALHVGIPTHLHAQLIERWGFPWVEGYGLTETGLVACMPLSRTEQMMGSGAIGLACPEVEVRIADDTGADVPVGSVGEILLRAPGLMSGYLNRPEATAETMRDGWLHTADLARIDGQGYLYLHGRKKDIIRRSGENIAAAEVEQVLRSHPEVLEAAVIPVADDIYGEEVHAVLVLIEGETPDTTRPAELVEYCRQRLAKHKLPRYVTYRASDFPWTPSMRVNKEAIRNTPPGWDRLRELGW